jgi:hypothetical protein
LDARQQGTDQKRASDLIFPTDVIALFFAVYIFSHAIFLINKGFLHDPDTYWHLVTGNWILAERQFPRQEIFSHTAFGHPWLDVEWLGQIILALIYNVLGWHGLILLCGLVLSLTFVLLYLLLARNLRPTIALGAATVSYIFSSSHFLARPHLLTFPIIVVWTAALARASEEKRRPTLWLLPLMMLWANLHGGFTIGLILAAAFGLESVIAAPATKRRRVAAEWLGFSLGALLVCGITPYGYQSLVRTYLGFNLGEVLNQIGEWRPMNAQDDYNQETILLCLLALALMFGAKIGFVRVLMVVGLLYLGLRHVRGTPIFALTLPLIIAHPLRQQFVFLRPTADPFPLFDRKGFHPLLTTVALIATLVSTSVLGMVYVILRPTDAPARNMTPAAALDQVTNASVEGPVLNDFDFGGYLIFRGIPTFIDGRTLPFGKEFALDYFKAIAPDGGSKLDELADKYKVTWTLLRPYSPAVFHFDLSPRWRRLYADDVAVVHVRR